MVNPSVCPPDTGFHPSGTDVELADVVRRFGPQYTSQYGALMMPSQKRALSDIAACGTKELGGRLYHCDDCRGTFWSFHCCRNRSCPKCHGTQTQEWLEKREAELLPATISMPSRPCRRSYTCPHGQIYRRREILRRWRTVRRQLWAPHNERTDSRVEIYRRREILVGVTIVRLPGLSLEPQAKTWANQTFSVSELRSGTASKSPAGGRLLLMTGRKVEVDPNDWTTIGVD